MCGSPSGAVLARGGVRGGGAVPAHGGRGAPARARAPLPRARGRAARRRGHRLQVGLSLFSEPFKFKMCVPWRNPTLLVTYHLCLLSFCVYV